MNGFSTWLCTRKRDALGVDERFGDCICGRGCLLSSEWCNRVSCKRRECTSFNAATRSDHAAKCPRNQGSLRDPLRARIHFQLHAGADFIPPPFSIFMETDRLYIWDLLRWAHTTYGVIITHCISLLIPALGVLYRNSDGSLQFSGNPGILCGFLVKSNLHLIHRWTRWASPDRSDWTIF